MKLKLDSSIVVHCPKKQIANNLMKIYEESKLVWCSGKKPVNSTFWLEHRHGTCVTLENKFVFGTKEFYLSKKRVISFDEFLVMQNIEKCGNEFVQTKIPE